MHVTAGKSVDFKHVIQFNEPKTIAQQLINFIEGYVPSTGRACRVAYTQDDGRYLVDITGAVNHKLLDKHSKTPVKDFIFAALKVASYITIILPLIALAIKAILRYTNKFHICKYHFPENKSNYTPDEISSIVAVWNKLAKDSSIPVYVTRARAEKFDSWINDNQGHLSNVVELENLMSLRIVPKELFHHTAMTQLNLNRNRRLSSLPDKFTLLRQLKVLSIDDTNISTLPESLRNCKNLREILLNGTPFKAFPNWLNRTTFPDLKRIYIVDTPLAKNPPKIKGVQVISEVVSDSSDSDSY